MPFAFTPTPPADALAFFRAKGWRIAFDADAVWRAENAAAFTVAKAMELDILAAIRYEVDKALANGVPFSEFKRSLQPTLERLGWWGRVKIVDPDTEGLQTAQLDSPSDRPIVFVFPAPPPSQFVPEATLASKPICPFICAAKY